MRLITLDFETYYDQNYSLSKISTEEYIRHPDFEVIGVAVKEEDNETVWFSGDYEDTKSFLSRYDWNDSLVLAHNTMFDGAILSWHYDIHPRALADTLSMARAVHGIEVGGSLSRLAEQYQLGAKGTEVINAKGKRRLDFTPEELARYGNYCCNDVELTQALFHAISGHFSTTELKLIDLTLRMFTEPVLVLDEEKLEAHLKETQARKAKLLSEVTLDKKGLMSSEKLAEELRRLGIDPPMKISPRTGQPTYAFSKTDKAFTELPDTFPPDSPAREVVESLVAARLGLKSTLEETRTERFIAIAKRGRLPIPLKYYAAHTGRWGGTDKVNLQNLPARGKGAGKLKHAICAPSGYVIIDCDSSQIEARTLAWMAGQDDLVEIFERNNEEIARGIPKDEHQYDPYKIMAATIYGKAPLEVTDSERFVGKTTILGAGYGMGAEKFRAQLAQFGVQLSFEECKHIIDTYRRTYTRIPLLWEEGNRCLKALLAMQTASYGRDGVVVVNPILGGFQTPNGIIFSYPGLHRTEVNYREQFFYQGRAGRVKIYGGKVTENCIAGGTPVLTERGWVPIEKVRATDRVHDGVEWVSHGGIVFKSVQPCVTVDGVYMTPDHEVLTDEGWKAALEEPRPYRPDLRHVDGVGFARERWQEDVVSFKINGGSPFDSVLPVEAKPTPRPVYDILNAGPRHRFVVMGGLGPLVVHNCIQHLARCIIGEQMLRIAKRYRVVLTVHDAVACIAPKEEAAEARSYVETCMKWRPVWCPDLPLACESGVGDTYGEC